MSIWRDTGTNTKLFKGDFVKKKPLISSGGKKPFVFKISYARYPIILLISTKKRNRIKPDITVIIIIIISSLNSSSPSPQGWKEGSWNSPFLYAVQDNTSQNDFCYNLEMKLCTGTQCSFGTVFFSRLRMTFINTV